MTTGREIIAYRPSPNVRGEVPPPATEPPPPEEIASADELFVTGLHLEQYRHATRCPTLYWREALRRDPLDSRCEQRPGPLASPPRRVRCGRNAFPQSDRAPHASQSESLRRRAVLQPGALPAISNRRGASPDTPTSNKLFDEAYAAFYKATWNQAWAAAGYHALAEMDCRRSRLGASLGASRPFAPLRHRQPPRPRSQGRRAPQARPRCGSRRTSGTKPSPSIRSIGGRASWPASRLRAMFRRISIWPTTSPGRASMPKRLHVLENVEPAWRTRRCARTLAPHAKSGARRRWSITRSAGCTSGRATANRRAIASSERRRSRPTTVSPRGSRKSPSSQAAMRVESARRPRSLLLGQSLLRPAASRGSHRPLGAEREARSELSRSRGETWASAISTSASSPKRPARPTIGPFAPSRPARGCCYERDQLWKRLARIARQSGFASWKNISISSASATI